MCTDFLQSLGHDLRAVVDSEDNIGDTSSGKSLDLVLDHGLVGELNERLGVCEGLWWGESCSFEARGALLGESIAGVRRGVREASDGYRTLRRE